MQDISTPINNSPIYTTNMIAVRATEKTKLGYMTVVSSLSVDQGNQIAYEFSKKNRLLKAIYHQRKFWIIRHPDDKSQRQEWQENLTKIADSLQEKAGKLDLTIQELGKVKNPEAEVIAKLATQILKSHASRSSWKSVICKKKSIEIYRYLSIKPETFSEKAAIILDWKTSARYPGTLKSYWLNHNKDNDCLKGLKVKNRFNKNVNGVVEEVIGYCDDDQKQRLLSYPNLHPSTQQIIQESNANDPIVNVKTRHWGKDSYADYVLDGLEITINEDNAASLGIDYDLYRSKFKIGLDEWSSLLNQFHEQCLNVLKNWYLQVEPEYINSQNDPENFDVSNLNKQTVKLLFGNNITVPRLQIKTGLTRGGVYRRHKSLEDSSIPLRVVILKLCKAKASFFLNNLESQLNSKNSALKFPITFLEKIPLEIEGRMSENDAVLIEKEMQKIIALEPDLVITILPKNDKQLDHTEKGSYYYHISNLLMPKGIASQMISEENLNNPYIINNVVLGILAKLGNLPFIFSEPLKIADYFIGLDVAHERKSRAAGTKNACACVRIYGASGEFIKYKLADSKIEGEEIPSQVLRKLLPFEDLSQKKVLIFRDGRFRGNEIPFLKERAEAIQSQFIFVEITKTGACRLFNQGKQGKDIKLYDPTQYLYFKHSEREVTIVTTKPLSGLAQPIRVNIVEGGIIPTLDDVIESVIKLCLLHHGSYIEAGIPIPIYASDKIGYKALKGLCHVEYEGEKQWWH